MPPTPDDTFEVGPYTIRRWDASDVSWIYDVCQDADIQRFTRLPSPFSAANAVAIFETGRTAWGERAVSSRAVALTETGELLGAVAISELDVGRGRARIGFWLAPDGRGRGVMAVVLSGVTRWTFDVLGLVQLDAVVVDGNARSEAVLARCGFSRVEATSCTSTDTTQKAWRWELRRPDPATAPMPRAHDAVQ